MAYNSTGLVLLRFMGQAAGAAFKMSFFIFPQKWIAPAIAAGVMAFGPLPHDPGPVTVHYINLPGKYIAATDPPTRIGIDKRPKSYWPKWKAQCMLVHEYGHLAGRKHSSNPRSIMRPQIDKTVCLRFLRRHHLR
jgi:hypothetical protein